MSGVVAMLMGSAAQAKPALPASLSASKADTGSATASITFNTSGTITDQDGVSLGNWVDIPAIAINTDFRVKYDWTANSNLTSYPSGASDNVYAADLSVARTFTLARGSIGVSTSTGTFTVEKISTGETDTASGSFQAAAS